MSEDKTNDGVEMDCREKVRNISSGNKDVHTEHCCARHGCKYSDPECTVETGKLKQSFPCERCRPSWGLRLQQLGASKYAEMQRLSDGWQKAEQELSALKVERDGLLEELNIVLKWLTESELVAAKAFAKSLRSALAARVEAENE